MEGIDDRFVWNKSLLSNFRCSDMDRFQLPLILGCKHNFLANYIDISPTNYISAYYSCFGKSSSN